MARKARVFKDYPDLTMAVMEAAAPSVRLDAEGEALLREGDESYAEDETLEGLWQYVEENHPKLAHGSAAYPQSVSAKVFADLVETAASSWKETLEVYADQNAQGEEEEEEEE